MMSRKLGTMFLDANLLPLKIQALMARVDCRLVRAFLILLPILVLVPISPVMASEEGITVFSTSQSDLNGDGLPDLTTIDCAFATDHDLIYVIDQGGDMQASTNWQEATDFSNDIWLYDIGADGSIQLIVVYRVEDGHETAYVYDDQDGDGQVRYEQTGTEITILETPYWSARIASPSTWYLPDGRLNLNLRIEMDGAVSSDRMPDSYRQGSIRQDGVVDQEFEQVADADGIARYAVLRLLTPSPSDMAFQRAGLLSNDGRYATRPFARAFFPFLPVPFTSGEAAQMDQRWFDLPPIVGIDWLTGKVLGVGQTGNPIGHGWLCNDDSYLHKGQVNDVSFECPLAYYDLADNHDAFPELNIRMFTFPAGDLRLPRWMRSSTMSAQEIYYSWNQFNPGTLRWDYKLGLADNYTIDAVEQFPDFALRKVPFEEFPAWIKDRTWKLTTFVARENRDYVSTEGIWDWSPLAGPDPVSRGDLGPAVRETALQYMLGMDSVSPDAYFKTINQGFRAERNFAGPAKPHLYFSPIDHKLHLFGAQWGIWKVDDTVTIQYFDRNDDGYVDEWQYLESDQVRQQVNVLSGYLVYSGNGEVVLKQTTVPPALFESAPPGNHAEWVALGEQLDHYQRDIAPGDFVGMLAPFDGPTTEIQGAAIRELRSTAQGFRFILELQPGFDAHLDQETLASSFVAPGTYVIEHGGKTLSARPATPASFHVSDLRVNAQNGALRALGWTTVEALLHNDGLEDEYTLPVCATIDGPAGPQVVMTDTVALLPGEGQQRLAWDWAPPSAGSWKIQVATYCGEPAAGASGEHVLGETTVEVSDSMKPSIPWLISLGGLVPRAVGLLLFATVALAGVVAAFWVRQSSS